MDFIVRPTGESPMNALRLLAEALSKIGLPQGWHCEAGPILIVLSAPESERPERAMLTWAWNLVRAACNGRDDLRPDYFSIGVG